jgi:cell division protein FtsZ
VRVTVIAAGFDEARPGRPAASAPLTMSRSSGSSGNVTASVALSAANTASAGSSASMHGRADQNAPSAGGAGQDGRSQDSRTGASSSTPASASAAWGGTSAPSSPAPAPAAPAPAPAPVTAPAVTPPVSAASADPVVAVPAQSGGDGASSGYVPSPVSFVSPDSDDDEEYGGKPATSYGAAWDRERDSEGTSATSAAGPSNWKDSGRVSKQDTVFDVTAGRRRPVVFEEDDDLDVPDFLK